MDLSLIPKVDRVILALEDEDYNSLLLAESAKEGIDRLRHAMLEGQFAQADKEELFELACSFTREIYTDKTTFSLRPVINATGVPLHTNLGRAPLAAEAVDTMAAVARGYCNLELSLATGKRGSRYNHVADLLIALTGAEDALVVNNNAAAVLLVLDTLAKGGEAIVSRGQLVEIGESFRIPDIMKKSGVELIEVGATNKTRLSDYQNAVTEQTRMIMQVHPSNFKVIGFHESVPTSDLVALAKPLGIPVMDDLGAGCLYPLAEQGIGEEPLVSRVVATGADIVTCSGDKLLGGPQAGIILGRREYIAKIKKNPLTRALRVDKFTLAALEATLRIYRRGEEQQLVPVVSMLTAPLDELKAKAELLEQLLAKADPEHRLYTTQVRQGYSESGGGSLPGIELPTYLVELTPLTTKAQELMALLRGGSRPLLAYIREDKLLYDPLTMSEEDIVDAARATAEQAAKFTL